MCKLEFWVDDNAPRVSCPTSGLPISSTRGATCSASFQNTWQLAALDCSCVINVSQSTSPTSVSFVTGRQCRPVATPGFVCCCPVLQPSLLCGPVCPDSSGRLCSPKSYFFDRFVKWFLSLDILSMGLTSSSMTDFFFPMSS